MSCVYTLSDVKAAALLAGSEYDAALGVWIPALVQQIEQYTGLSLSPKTDTIRVSGRWHPTIELPGRPIPESAAMTIRIWEDSYDGSGVVDTGVNFMGQNTAYAGTPPAALIQGQDYGVVWDKNWSGVRYSLSGRVKRNGRDWPGRLERRRGRLTTRQVPGQQNIEISYGYGFADPKHIPPIFLTAVAAGVRLLLTSVPAGGLLTTSQSLDGASVGGQPVQPGGSGGPGLNVPQMGSVMSMLSAWVAPKTFEIS